jgi:Fe-S cluster assembly protein SufD
MTAMGTATAERREPMLTRLMREFDASVVQLPEQVLPLASRRAAAHELSRLGWPVGRDEHWRYANLRAMERIGSFVPPRRERSKPHDLSLPPLLRGFQRLVFVDGVQALDGIAALPHALPAVPASWGAGQRLGLLNDMFAQDAAVLRVAGEAAFEVIFITTEAASGAAVYPRLHIELAAEARLTLIERHLGDARESTLTSVAANIELARAAQLTHYRLQQCGGALLFNDSLRATLQEQASYEVRQIFIGALAARSSAHVRLAGRAASLGWQGLAIGQGEQVHDATLQVEHAAPATRTEQGFRGIADARSRVAFSGHIHIQSTAPGSQARQSLRGLIEGPHAEIDLLPRLQIDVDEVNAQHGATTGQLDENLLFYLLSRGLEPLQARALLKWAFLGDVLRSIRIPELRAQAEQAAAGQLADAEAIGELSAARALSPGVAAP